MVRVFTSARILDTGRGSDDATRVVDILVDGTKIGRIADHVDPPRGAGVVDASRYLVTPGFVNAHGHLAMTLLRGLADEVPLDMWLHDYMFPREALMNGDDIYYGSLLALAEGIMSGTTTFAEMYFFEDDVARAVDEAGVRANLSTGTASLDNERGKLEKSVEFVVRWNNKADGRIRTSFGPHAPYTASPEFVRENFERARDLGVIVQLHLHETCKEIEEFTAAYGASPITYYAEEGYFGNPAAAPSLSVPTSSNPRARPPLAVAIARRLALLIPEASMVEPFMSKPSTRNSSSMSTLSLLAAPSVPTQRFSPLPSRSL